MFKRDAGAGEARGRHLGRVSQQQHESLRRYFMTQFDGDESEADECVRETLRHFLFFMEDRCRESEKDSHIYVMRIAGSVCSKRLAEKRSRRATGLGGWNPLRGVVARLIRAVGGRADLMKPLPGSKQRPPRGKGTK